MEIKIKNKNKTNLSHIRSFADIVVLQVGNVVANGANLLHSHIVISLFFSFFLLNIIFPLSN